MPKFRTEGFRGVLLSALLVTSLLAIFSVYAPNSKIAAAPNAPEVLNTSGTSTLTTYPIADAYVEEGHPDANYGTQTKIIARSNDTGFGGLGQMRGFLKFDISGIPAGATITEAKLRIHCYYITDYIENVSDVQIRQVMDDSWDETSIDWNNQPAYGSILSNIILLENDSWAGSHPIDNWYENDVTSFVQNQFDNGDTTISLMIRCMQEYYDNLYYRGSYFHSKEAALENRPTLIVTYEPPLEHGLTPHAPIYINGNDNFTPANGVVAGNGMENNPYIIEDWDINAENATGIWIGNTTAHFAIRNCYVHDGVANQHSGITFDNVVNGVVDNNTCPNNGSDVILLLSSSNNLIENNIVENDPSGIYLYNSSNNLISGNNVSNNYNGGINLASGSDNNLIENNIVENNTNYGIYLYWDSNYNLISGNTLNNDYYSITLYSHSNYNLVSGNTLRNNYYGIYFYDSSDYSLISGNTLENNYYGIGIYYSSNYNLFCHNNIINNTNQTTDSGSNYWDNGYPSGGNYWSDYTGVDENYGDNQNIPGSDGIGDTPYNISGGSSVDRYPLIWVGTATFKLENLYKVRLERDLQLYAGSKLVVKFYDYFSPPNLEGENVVHENFALSANVEENENIPHPAQGTLPVRKAVKKAELVLTTDNENEVISIIASFTVHRSQLRNRYVAILVAWAINPPLQGAFRSELMDILGMWASAPT
jgi:parallel beta-helix repeat protein